MSYGLVRLLFSARTIVQLEFDNYIEKKDSPYSYRKGHLSYILSEVMVLNETHICKFRINLGKIESFNSKEQNYDEFKISKLLSVKLFEEKIEEVFKIIKVGSEEQFVGKNHPAFWEFHIIPLKLGKFPIRLKVSFLKVIDGKEKRADVILEKEINIESKKPLVNKQKEKVFKSFKFLIHKNQISLKLSKEILFTSPRNFEGAINEKNDNLCFRLPGFYEKNMISMFIEGNSMEPIFYDGDMVIGSEVKSFNEIVDGDSYIINSDGATWVKQIKKLVNFDGEVMSLKLMPANSLEFDPWVEEINSNTKIFKVIGRINKF